MTLPVRTAGEWFIIGGLDAQSEQRVQIYSFSANKWRSGASLPFKAGSASSAEYNGKVCVLACLWLVTCVTTPGCHTADSSKCDTCDE